MPAVVLPAVSFSSVVVARRCALHVRVAAYWAVECV